MTDNINVTPGTGKTIAADEVAGVLFQRVKVGIGADGVAIDLDSGQEAMTGSLPVVIASDQSAVPVSDGGGALTVDGSVTVSDGGGSLTVDGAVTATLQAGDGNPVEFSCAVVGAHVHVADLSTKHTATKPAGATGLLAQATGTTAVRWTLDGTDPINALGFQLPIAQMPVVIPCPGAAIEFIQEAAGAALDYQWVK